MVNGGLKREAETNQELYNGLLRRIKEAGVTAGLRASNIRIVDPALMPSQPTRPRKKLNIMLAAVVGLLGGVSLAFLREHMDNTIKPTFLISTSDMSSSGFPVVNDRILSLPQH